MIGWLDPLLPVAGDPFRWTPVVVPGAVAALTWIARACRRAGGRRLPRRLLAAEGGALVLLLAAIPGARALDLPHADPVLAAALFALLGVHVLSQGLALRPLLRTSSRSAGAVRPSVLFLLLPLVVYWALLPWAAANRPPDGDEPYYLLLAHSLAYDLDVDLANNYAAADWRRFMDREIEPQPGDPRGPEGEIYSRHDATLPALLALPYRLAGRTGALAVMSLLAAALAWTGLCLALRVAPAGAGDPRRRGGAALLAWALLAFTPPLLLYAHQVWVEVPAALALAVGFERLLAMRGEATESAREGSWARSWLPLAGALLLLPLLKIRFALIAVPAAALAIWSGGRSRRAVTGVAAVLAAGLGAVLLVNQIRYGNPLKMHSWQELDLTAFGPSRYAEGLFGLFWDGAFGLFFFAPVWLLVIPAALRLLAPDHPGGPRDHLAGGRRLAAQIAVTSLPYLMVVAPRAEWYGGWSPPFRYGVVLLPLLVALLVPLLADRHRPGARAVLTALGLATATLTLIWLAIPGWTYDLADGRTRLLDALGTALGADASRLFPSYVRPRLASWLWPPMSAALVVLAWWLPAGRLRRGRLPALAAPAGVGAALLFVGLAVVPPAAKHLPTRVVELEDPWIEHRGGHLHPETWTVARSHYRSGWVIRPHEEVRVPLVPGGDRVELALEIQLGRYNPDPITLEVAEAGVEGRDRRLATWDAAAAGSWHRVELGPFEWKRDGNGRGPRRELILRALGPPRAGRQNGFLLDRMEVRWH